MTSVLGPASYWEHLPNPHPPTQPWSTDRWGSVTCRACRRCIPCMSLHTMYVSVLAARKLHDQQTPKNRFSEGLPLPTAGRPHTHPFAAPTAFLHMLAHLAQECTVDHTPPSTSKSQKIRGIHPKYCSTIIKYTLFEKTHYPGHKLIVVAHVCSCITLHPAKVITRPNASSHWGTQCWQAFTGGPLLPANMPWYPTWVSWLGTKSPHGRCTCMHARTHRGCMCTVCGEMPTKWKKRDCNAPSRAI